MRVVLYTPVRQSAEILALALESHRALKGISERWYVDDNDDMQSSTLLADEARRHGVRVFLGRKHSGATATDPIREVRGGHACMDESPNASHVGDSGFWNSAFFGNERGRAVHGGCGYDSASRDGSAFGRHQAGGYRL